MEKQSDKNLLERALRFYEGCPDGQYDDVVCEVLREKLTERVVVRDFMSTEDIERIVTLMMQTTDQEVIRSLKKLLEIEVARRGCAAVPVPITRQSL